MQLIHLEGIQNCTWLGRKDYQLGILQVIGICQSKLEVVLENKIVRFYRITLSRPEDQLFIT